jgi:integrase
LLTLIYRYGLRVSEAVDLRWADFDLDAPKARPFHVRRLKGSKDSVHTLEPDTVRPLKRLQSDADGPYVFRSSAVVRCPSMQSRLSWRGRDEKQV